MSPYDNSPFYFKDMKTLAIIIIVATVVGLVLYALLHKEEGVVQRVKVYGGEFIIKTFVYVGGRPVDGWVDTAETEFEFKRIKQQRKEQAQDFYETLTFQKKY